MTSKQTQRTKAPVTTAAGGGASAGVAVSALEEMTDAEMRALCDNLSNVSVEVQTDNIEQTISTMSAIDMNPDAILETARLVSYKSLDKIREFKKLGVIAEGAGVTNSSVAMFYAVLYAVRGNVVKVTNSKFSEAGLKMVRHYRVGIELPGLGVLKPSMIGTLMPYFQWQVNAIIYDQMSSLLRNPVQDPLITLHPTLRFGGAAGLITNQHGPLAAKFVAWTRAHDAIINRKKANHDQSSAERFARNIMENYSATIVAGLPKDWNDKVKAVIGTDTNTDGTGL